MLRFSVMESEHGDYLLSPAYDLMCTSLHLSDSDICMRDGLYDGDHNEADFLETGIYRRKAFISFAEKMDIPLKLAESIIDELTGKEEAVREMIGRSFLSDKGKAGYLKYFRDRQKRLSKKFKI